MTNPSTPGVIPPTSDRPVLMWRPDADESQVQPSLEQAAQFLNLGADEVAAAIEQGELVGGWFVDWEAGGAA